MIRCGTTPCIPSGIRLALFDMVQLLLMKRKRDGNHGPDGRIVTAADRQCQTGYARCNPLARGGPRPQANTKHVRWGPLHRPEPAVSDCFERRHLPRLV